MTEPVSPLALSRWAETLSAIARTGLAFTESVYERERFEEVLKVAGDIRAAADSGEVGHPDGVTHAQEWLDRVDRGIVGYVTPKVAVGAAVFNDQGELLLIQRSDSGHWIYPTGYCDVGYSAVEVVAKEVEEETGITVEVERVLGILDTLRLGSRIPLYSILFLCRAVGGELNPHPLEVTNVGWFTRDNLPSPLIGADRWVDHVFAAGAGERRGVFYDDLRSPIWRSGKDDE